MLGFRHIYFSGASSIHADQHELGRFQADYDTGTNENDGHFRRLGDTGRSRWHPFAARTKASM